MFITIKGPSSLSGIFCLRSVLSGISDDFTSFFLVSVCVSFNLPL